MVTVAGSLALFAAGLLAGLVGTAGGITTLVSYPALLAAGVPPLAANTANIVALVACWPGAALISRRELSGHGRWIWRWSLVAAGGGAAGTGLLLLTPPGVFVQLVPVLVLFGAVLLLLQPRLSAMHAGADQEVTRGGRWVLPVGLVGAAIYNGYFGAGSGIIILALLLLTVDQHLPGANARKNMLIGATSLVSAAVLIVGGSVAWAVVAPLGAGMFLGSLLGPIVARRLPAPVVRIGAAVLGIALAVQLWLSR